MQKRRGSAQLSQVTAVGLQVWGLEFWAVFMAKQHCCVPAGVHAGGSGRMHISKQYTVRDVSVRARTAHLPELGSILRTDPLWYAVNGCGCH